MHFRSVKDIVVPLLHRFGFIVAGLQGRLGRGMLACIGALARAAYFVPNSRVRRAVCNFCRATGRSDPWPIYSRMVDNAEHAVFHYAVLSRYGRAQLLSQTVIDPSWAAEYRRFTSGKSGFLALVPHCFGGVLSSAALSSFCPTALLVRESRSPERDKLMVDYLQKLGPKLILSRNEPPATVMRGIVRSLRDSQVVVGTTDVVAAGPDTIETQAFGQRIFSPAWPARISARFGIPLVPIFIRMDGPQIRLIAAEGFLEADIQQCMQRWVSSFEQWFRQYPSDWAFMLDKHWARVLSAAADANSKDLAALTRLRGRA